MTEKEWQRIKRLDISFVVIGGVGTLLITAMIVFRTLAGLISSPTAGFYPLWMSGW